VLGTLARHGALHGHAIRQMAHQDRTELWTDVKVGSLYGALRKLSEEGLVEPVAKGQNGNLPPHTIYRISDAGLAEFRRLRDAALMGAELRPDPCDLAIAMSDGLGPNELAAALGARLAAVRQQARQRSRLGTEVESLLSASERTVFDHYRLRYRAEEAWLESILVELERRGKAEARPVGEPAVKLPS
jgi:DNA-binding PadR family transcriptional regulator